VNKEYRGNSGANCRNVYPILYFPTFRTTSTYVVQRLSWRQPKDTQQLCNNFSLWPEILPSLSQKHSLWSLSRAIRVTLSQPAIWDPLIITLQFMPVSVG